MVQVLVAKGGLVFRVILDDLHDLGFKRGKDFGAQRFGQFWDDQELNPMATGENYVHHQHTRAELGDGFKKLGSDRRPASGWRGHVLLKSKHPPPLAQASSLNYTRQHLSKEPDFQFALPELSESTNLQTTQQMNNHKNDCGCFTGGLFMGISVLSIVATFVLGYQQLSDMDLKRFAFLALLTVACAMLGKLVGLLWARFRMIQVVRRTVALAINHTY